MISSNPPRGNNVPAQTDQEHKLASILIDALELEDIQAEEIIPDARLFGDDDNGLGLDSIDALEIALAVSEHYGVELKADDEGNREIFASLRSLSQHIEKQVQG